MQNILQPKGEIANQHTRCKSCGDLMKDEARETYCKTCLAYTYAWIHIQRAKEYLEQAA